MTQTKKFKIFHFTDPNSFKLAEIPGVGWLTKTIKDDLIVNFSLIADHHHYKIIY